MDYKEDILMSAQLLSDSIKRIAKIEPEEIEHELDEVESNYDVLKEHYKLDLTDEVGKLKLIANIAGKKMHKLAMDDNTTNKEKVRLLQQSQMPALLNDFFWCIVRQFLEPSDGITNETIFLRRNSNRGMFITIGEDDKPSMEDRLRDFLSGSGGDK